MVSLLEFEKIVVRVPNWVGDVVMCTPALRSIREFWPDSEITVMGLPTGEKILAGSPRFDRFETYRRNGPDGGLFGRGRIIRRLRKERFDLGILMPNSFSSGWLFWRAGVKRRLGTTYGGRNFTITDAYMPPMEGKRRVPRSMVEHYFDLLEEFRVPRGDPKLELFETEEGKQDAREILGALGVEDDDRLVAIVPGASFGISKMWKSDRFAAVADHLQEQHGLKPLLLGGPGEEIILHEIETAMKTPALSTGDDPLDLDALKTAVKRSSLMIATDAGPRHYGVAFDVPIVTMLGPTDPRFSESNTEKTIVLRVDDLECSPCHLKTCPLAHHGCMSWIETEQVIEACEELLKRYPPAPPAETENAGTD
ncbi:MAG: lipopolysaccharide heptosyltransferase II [Planctomycetota bacterium]